MFSRESKFYLKIEPVTLGRYQRKPVPTKKKTRWKNISNLDFLTQKYRKIKVVRSPWKPVAFRAGYMSLQIIPALRRIHIDNGTVPASTVIFIVAKQRDQDIHFHNVIKVNANSAFCVSGFYLHFSLEINYLLILKLYFRVSIRICSSVGCKYIEVFFSRTAVSSMPFERYRRTATVSLST